MAGSVHPGGFDVAVSLLLTVLAVAIRIGGVSNASCCGSGTLFTIFSSSSLRRLVALLLRQQYIPPSNFVSESESCCGSLVDQLDGLSGPVIQKTLVAPQVQFSQSCGHACCHAPNGFLRSAVRYSGTVERRVFRAMAATDRLGQGDSWIVKLVSVVASRFVYCRQRCGDDSANERTNDCTDGYLSSTCSGRRTSTCF